MRQRSPATTRTCVSIPMGLATSAMRVLPNVGVRCRPAPQSRETPVRASFCCRPRRHFRRGRQQNDARTGVSLDCGAGRHRTPTFGRTLMADVASPIGILTQVRVVAGLRWRILRNGLRKKASRFDLLGLILLGVFSGFFVVGLCVAFFTGAYAFLSEGRFGLFGLLFWCIFLFWQLFPIFAAGFGASFEFRSMLRFPLNLTAFYVIGLAYGLADFSAVASVCWLASMTLGAAAARPGVLPAMLLVAALFLLLNVTLERLVGSWLERLLSRRRTRELFFALFILAMVSLNLIEPTMRHYGGLLGPLALRIIPYFAWLPPALAGRAIAAAAEARFGW